MDFVGTIIDPNDLEKISSLGELHELYLPGPSWTPASGSSLDANDALKYLAGLTNLELLYFSSHFLPTFNVQDKGIAYLAGMKKLMELRLAQSQVLTPDLAPFVHLKSLDLSDSTFTNEGMKVLEQMHELRRLYLRNTKVTDEGLRHLNDLTQLNELDLYGVNVTDHGLESLRKLTAMQKLANLLGAEVSDASVRVLAQA